MSQDDDVAALRRAYKGWAAGDMSAGASLFDPHVVYISDPDEPDPGPHYGLEALNAYTRGWMGGWEKWGMEAISYRQVENSIVVQTRLSAVGKGSGIHIEGESFHVWTFRGGRAIRFEVFEEEEAALEAVGLSE